MGAVAPYDQAAIMPEVCELISQGMLVKDVAAALKVSTVSIRRWGASDEWRTAYTRAREDQAHAMAEDVFALAKTATNDNYNAIRVQVDTAKWLTSKIAPKLFGEKLDVSGTIEHLHRAVVINYGSAPDALSATPPVQPQLAPGQEVFPTIDTTASRDSE